MASGLSPWGTCRGWRPIEAFTAGHRRRIVFMPAEVGVLPTLPRLRERRAGPLDREATSGLTTEDNVARQAEGALGVDGWLRAHGE